MIVIRGSCYLRMKVISMHSTTKGLGNEVADVLFNEFEKSHDRSSSVCPKNGSGDSRSGPGNGGVKKKSWKL